MSILNKITFLGLMTIATASFAGTSTYTIEGMTCGNCVKSVKKEVCSLPGVTKCEVEVGSVKLTVPEGQTLDEALLKKAVEKAGYNLTGKAK